MSVLVVAWCGVAGVADFNIETQRGKEFGQYVCSLLKHLNQRMGPGLVYSMTPCCRLQAMYSQVQAQCGRNISLIQPQTRSNKPLTNTELRTYAPMFGYDKTAFLIDTTKGGSNAPSASGVWDDVKSFKQQHPGAPGVFTWTAEHSFECTPQFCMEKVIADAQRLHEPAPGLLDCKC